MNTKSLVSISDLSREEILSLLDTARKFEEKPNRRLLEGKVVATLFFEPSTRTRLSFETAVNRLGGRVIGFSDASNTSTSKGETLKDTIKMVSNYADLIVMRHFLEGAALYATEVSDVPIINAGDGAHQHPSQTMLDLYSIYKTQGTLENLTITLVGDLKYGRTVHSLIMAMKYFNPTFRFVACTTSCSDTPLSCATCFTTYGRYKELLRFPRYGSGAIYGQSVSSTICSNGILATASFSFLAFLKVTTPPIPI